MFPIVIRGHLARHAPPFYNPWMRLLTYNFSLFAALSCLTWIIAPQLSSAAEIAITFDDLPAHGALPAGTTRDDVARQIIAALHAATVPDVYGFVNGRLEQDDPTSRHVLSLWRRSGFLLGNHTWSHQGVSAGSVAHWEADVLANEPVLSRQSGSTDWRWLRFPYLDEGSTPDVKADVRSFLHAHAYRIAQVTIDFKDYAFNAAYARCGSEGQDAIGKLEQAYLSAASSALERSRSMSRTLYSRDIPYVLLLHLGALEARMLPALLQLYQNAGLTFVTLPKAERDPFYHSDVDLDAPATPDTLEAAMAADGLAVPQRPDLAFLDTMCR